LHQSIGSDSSDIEPRPIIEVEAVVEPKQDHSLVDYLIDKFFETEN
jgi:hypothetical protein